MDENGVDIRGEVDRLLRTSSPSGVGYIALGKSFSRGPSQPDQRGKHVHVQQPGEDPCRLELKIQQIGPCWSRPSSACDTGRGR